MQRTHLKIVQVISFGLVGLGLLALYWYLFIALKEEPMTFQEILSTYNYQAPQSLDISLTPLGNNQFGLSFTSFDGDRVNGQIRYPQAKKSSHPVLLGVSAMGRSHERWWSNSYKERPTITQVNKMTDIAIDKGYAVIAIDARYHGSRKNPKLPISTIMNRLHYLGDKTAYEDMIRKTVLDYRVLIHWLSTQPQLDETRINLAGYSTGAQIVLLLSTLEEHIQQVISLAPPYLDNKVAAVAPINFVPHSRAQKLLLITADNDEFATQAENTELFKRIDIENKQHQVFPGSHILPPGYIDTVAEWLE